jgi:tetratricopeptide (TPR) repeat protein
MFDVSCNFHCQFLSLENVNEMIAISNYPSYLDWKSICETNKTSERERLYALANLYEQNGEDAAARSLKTPLVRQEAERRYKDRQSQGFDTSKLDCLAEIVVERKDYASAIITYTEAIEKEPENFWLWHGLCRVYIGRDGLEAAIAMCKKAIIDNLDNSRTLPCLVELALYAATNDYVKAEHALDLLWEHCRYIVQQRQDDLRQMVVERLKLKIALPDETRYHTRPYGN